MDEKYGFYFERTLKHIQRVQNSMLMIALDDSNKLELSLDEKRALMYNVCKHDQSKFNSIQFQGYVDFSWYKHKKYDLPKPMMDKFQEAWKNHQKCENHHPTHEKGNLYKATKLEMIEIACDLQAMAQEFGESSGRKYFEETWKKNNSKYFYDDFNWQECITYVSKCFDIFETERSK